MRNTVVEVRKAAPPPMSTPDIWRSFRSEMDRLLQQFHSAFGLALPRQMPGFEPTWPNESTLGFSAPAVDVSEDEKAYSIAAELPGLEEKNIEVFVSGDMIVLKGEKRQQKEEMDKNQYLSERAYDAFERSFYLPDSVDRDKITAAFEKGVLTISLPKKAETQTPQKKIEVKAA